MIDLHCHILPGIDDGAPDLATALEMARLAVADGIHTTACTPHIYPGLYLNDAAGIQAARDALQVHLQDSGIDLRLVTGADVHLVPGLLEQVRRGVVPTLARSRYLLLEPSHHVVPPRFLESVFGLIVAGYTPVITHPERLLWIADHHELFAQLIRQGAWMQVTAGALTGVFGPRARYWGERFIGEGQTHLLASDAHSAGRRVPRLAEARDIAARLVGAQEAARLVLDRPQAILDNRPPAEVPPPPAPARRARSGAWWGRWLAKGDSA